MKSVKVKTAVPKKFKAGVTDLNKMFEQMTGAACADVEVIQPKYLAVRTAMRELVKAYGVFVDFKEFVVAFPGSAAHVVEIGTFCGEVTAALDADAAEVASISTMTQQALNTKWRALKQAPVVKKFIITVGRLKRFEQFLKDTTSLDDGFIRREPGLDLCPFAFSGLDLKQVWASDNATPTIKRFIMSILAKTYALGFSIYDHVTSPDIDIKKFSEVLINAIEILKKQLPRCDRAFKVIADSVKLLEQNFKSYYKASIQAENPSLIMENFIVDVSITQKGNMQVMQQFKRIISHLKQKSSGVKDPRIKSLFKMLNDQFDMADKQYKAETKTDSTEANANAEEANADADAEEANADAEEANADADAEEANADADADANADAKAEQATDTELEIEAESSKEEAPLMEPDAGDKAEADGNLDEISQLLEQMMTAQQSSCDTKNNA